MDYREQELNENITMQYDERNSVCGWDENECKEEDDGKECS